MAQEHEKLQFPELVDIETAARLLGITVRHLRRFVAERKIPYVKVGGLIRFDVEELRRWIEERRRPPSEGTPA
jgi:excisionase family DNA binding protein